MKCSQTLICAAIALLSSFSIIAQKPFQGYFSVQAGFGALPTYFLDGTKTKVPPLNVSINYRLSPVLSAGLFTGFSANKILRSYRDGSVHQWENNSLVYGAQIRAHSASFKKVDLYGGARIAYSQPDVSHTVIIPGEDMVSEPKIKKGIVYGGYMGIAAALTKKIGLYGELGYGISILDLGLNVKL